MCPWRSAVSGLAAAVNAIDPAPCPEAGERPVIQLALVDALHAHSGFVDTVIVPVPPDASTVPAPVPSVSAHLTGEGFVET